MSCLPQTSSMSVVAVLDIMHQMSNVITENFSLVLQPAWSNRGQQLLVATAWPQMTAVGVPPTHPVPPPTSSLTNDSTICAPRISEWGLVESFFNADTVEPRFNIPLHFHPYNVPIFQNSFSIC